MYYLKIQYFIARPSASGNACLSVYSKWITFRAFQIGKTSLSVHAQNLPTTKYTCNAIITLQTDKCKCQWIIFTAAFSGVPSYVSDVVVIVCTAAI